MYAEKTNVIWKVSFVAGVINVGANLLLIPFYGFTVAAYTTFIAFMYMGYAGFYFKIFRQINAARYYPVFWMSVTVFLTGAVYWMVELPAWIKIIVTATFVFGGAVAMRKINAMIKEA
jgi:O-antigen/teichoic acid export membrane protein